MESNNQLQKLLKSYLDNHPGCERELADEFRTAVGTLTRWANGHTRHKVDIAKLAHKVSSEQNKLLKSGIYFYTPQAKKKYLKWARVNLAIWDNVNEALKDDDVLEMLSIAERLKAL